MDDFETLPSDVRRKVLIVDDEPAIRESLAEFLESEGFRVVTATNGQEALEQLMNGDLPALILLDLTMPVMGGSEFLDLAHARLPHAIGSVPVLVMSALVNPAVGRRYPRTEFIRKPFDLDRLLDRVVELSAPAIAGS